MLEKGKLAEKKKFTDIRGFDFELRNGDTITIPYIGIGTGSDNCWDLVQQFQEANDNENMKQMQAAGFELFHKHMAKYYNVTKEELEDMLDWPSLIEFMAKVQGTEKINEIQKKLMALVENDPKKQ